MTDLIQILEQSVDVKKAKAQDILTTGKVPASGIEKRPGAGGRSFSYVKHTYATRLLQDGMGALWSFETLDWEVYQDTLKKWAKEGNKKVKKAFKQRSIAAQVRLTITYPLRDETPDKWHKQVITEIGAFEPNEGMTTANAVASAVSRGLCKCLMRGLGVGLELYEDDSQSEITPKQAWNILKRYLERRGVEWTDDFKDELTEALKKEGINSDNIVDDFTKAWEVAGQFLESEEEMPADL